MVALALRKVAQHVRVDQTLGGQDAQGYDEVQEEKEPERLVVDRIFEHFAGARALELGGGVYEVVLHGAGVDNLS